MSLPEFKKGLHPLNPGVFAYLQPDGAWGLNNTGLMVFEDDWISRLGGTRCS